MQKQILHLKLNRPHPANRMPVQDIVVIGYDYKPYEITEANGQKVVEELMSKGGRHWIACKELIESENESEDEEETEETAPVSDPAPADVAAESPATEAAPAPDMIDETQTIEDKPAAPEQVEKSAEEVEYDKLEEKKLRLTNKEKARLAELRHILGKDTV